MRLMGANRGKLGREFILLAPAGIHHELSRYKIQNVTLHSRLLTSAQRLRGEIYVEDGAIRRSELSAGRHVQPADEKSWHLLTVERDGRVSACLRYCAHRPGVKFPQLAVARSTVARSSIWGAAVREGIEAELDRCLRRGFAYVELGGWAIRRDLRHTTEAINILIAVYALSKLLGGAHGLSMATTRHHSSSILKRIGGTALRAGARAIPPYFDSYYGCDMELLRFDSASPNPRYLRWIDECCSALRDVPVISGMERASTLRLETSAPYTPSISADRLALATA